MGHAMKTKTIEYSPTKWKFRYIMGVCTFKEKNIARALEIPEELVLKWKEDKKKMSDDKIIKQIEIKYIDNINKNFGNLLDVEVRHLKRKLGLKETENRVQKKQINMMKRIVGKTKFKEIHEKAKDEVIWHRRHKVDMSKLKKRGKKDD
ncbi:hypothetical protein HMPREF2956_02075 [Staphylococcus sp. HMSC055B03]|uniref:hypothetical protein n=2 Tax=Staphylococcus TaxID=1279 RepID=UPI00066C8E11|nr:hypothetical protein [Staphylococcus epidermidis]OFS35726.1 hypothetical protein HMPREF2956_02075 [Staphylococcus sp. HMSC055B03]